MELYAVLAVELSNGALASIAISGGHPRPHTGVTDEVRVWCSKGAVHLVDGQVYVEDSESNVTRVDRAVLPRRSPNPYVNFVRTILGREENLVPGTVFLIPAGENHWHGATDDSDFTHISILRPGETRVRKEAEK
ncbi:MAG: hypothetical protein QXF26_07425 [Candidatus Bathyarchaeia archaeon]